MKDNFKFLAELIILRLSHIMTFRLGFFGPFFVDTSYFLVQLFAFEAIYGHVDNIRGWGHGEILVFVGTFSLINALNMTIYFFGVLSIPEKIQTGELDLYLTKPVNPLLRITFEKINPGSIPLLAFSACIIIYGVKKNWNELFVATYYWISVFGHSDDNTVLRFGTSDTMLCFFRILCKQFNED